MFCANRHGGRRLAAVSRELIRMSWRLGVTASIASVNSVFLLNLKKYPYLSVIQRDKD